MEPIVYLYLVSVLITAVFFVITIGAFLHHRNRVRQYEVLEARLPEACRYDHLASLVAERETRLEALRSQVASAEAVIEQKQKAEQWLVQARQELESLAAERARQEQLRIDLAQLQKDLAEKTELHRQRQEEIQHAELRLRQVQQEETQAASAASDLKGQLQQLTEQLHRAQQEKAALAAQEEGLRTALAHLQEQRVATENTLAQLRDAHEQLQNRINLLEREETQISRRLDQTKHDLAWTQQQLQDLKRQQEQLERQAEDIQERKAELARNVAALTTQVDALGREAQDLQNKTIPLRQQLEQDSARLAAVRDEFEVLSAKVNGLSKQEQILQQVISTLQEELKGLRVKAGQTPDGQEARLADLWAPFLTDGTVRRDQPDELVCLKSTAAYLQQRGLRFPERVLHAFHTSLKVADVSPLVVLAGISGTGKSELPRRYAEAMGLHFLNIAVQPRWDSPQDMFGFFNYLEGRYRATELARALVQMDPYHNRSGRGWDAPKNWAERTLSDQMLLVLLDEMNLARIEYYFSEFLSRLEIRRGVCRTDDQDRRKAEIPLEVGLRRDGVSTLQLFVDSNVLFVGTMNEDETTQSLSDKVVDRANVLRFGKPANMARPPGRPDLAVPREHLPHAAWRRWIRSEKDLSPEQGAQVDEWIRQLNEAMSGIHRPFAYRTHLAMRTYVANYPGTQNDPDSLGFAMADQIEQKILPKFRGVDLTEGPAVATMEAVISLLRELKDTQLADAVDACRQGGQFIWQGLDRSPQPEAVR